MLLALVEHLWSERPESAEHAALRAEVRALALEHLLRLASDAAIAPRVQQVALARVHALAKALASRTDAPPALWEAERLRRFFQDPRAEPLRAPEPRIPPGSPIGAIGCGER